MEITQRPALQGIWSHRKRAPESWAWWNSNPMWSLCSFSKPKSKSYPTTHPEVKGHCSATLDNSPCRTGITWFVNWALYKHAVTRRGQASFLILENSRKLKRMWDMQRPADELSWKTFFSLLLILQTSVVSILLVPNNMSFCLYSAKACAPKKVALHFWNQITAFYYVE